MKAPPEAVSYFTSVEDVLDALHRREVDAVVLTGETPFSGLTEIALGMLDQPTQMFVAGEVVVPYHCMLLGRPGATLADVELVLGHGSLDQCRPFLTEFLPHAQVRRHEHNSLAAVGQVLESGGRVALVGTRRAGREHGLEVLAADIDRGALGAWWVLTRDRVVSTEPAVVVVGVVGANGGSMQELSARMRTTGMTLRSIATRTRAALFEYDFLAVFTGPPEPRSVDQALAGVAGATLFGAFARSIVGPAPPA